MHYTQEFILEHIKKHHPDKEDIQGGDLAEKICQADYYILEDIPLELLPENIWFVDDSLIEYYLTVEELPPIVVENNRALIDGLHQIKVAKLRKQATIKAFRGYDLK